jgi:ribosomal protein S18 acetylase RimI-like enzyme
VSDTAGVLIREAREDDLPAIVHVFAGDALGGRGDLWTEANAPAYRRAFAAIVASPDNTLFVVEADGAVIGTFQVTVIPGLVGFGRTRAKVESVHVRPEWRGKGIGERMVAHAEAFAREAGAGSLELSSNKSRLDAHRFYRRLGFAQSHEGFKKAL